MAKDCGPRCRSKQHAYELLTAVTKADLEQAKAFISRCHNGVTISDRVGRNVLHIASSRGHWQLVEWLLTEKNAELSSKDLESGWTALHRSLFYGQLFVARLLISYGSNLEIRDREGHAPLDILMKDRELHIPLAEGPQDVYTWGDNSNFTLGHDNMTQRKQPEVVETFRKTACSIKQAVMCKYHSVFLTMTGQVYTCGHGRGGRLGHGDEQTVLVPRLVEAVKDEECVLIAATRDCTVMLMKNGAIYCCGMNEGHVQDQSQAVLAPKLIWSKQLRGVDITGILVQRFHTILWSKNSVLTLGLNAGQLGHQKIGKEVRVNQPRPVSAFSHKDVQILHVAASDAATVVSTSKGDVYTLHDYQCRKIASKWLDVVKIAVSGGQLDHSAEGETLQEKGGSELTVLLLNSAGKVYIWHTSEPNLKRCTWALRRSPMIVDLTLSLNRVGFVTKDGEAFIAKLPHSKLSSRDLTSLKDVLASSPTDSFTMTLKDFVDREDIEELTANRVPNVYRATSITSDRKGLNFAVLQTQPNSWLIDVPSVESSEMGTDFLNLYEEADEMDLIHDCVIQVGQKTFAAHRYILAYRSEHFRKSFTAKSDESILEDSTFNIEGVNPDLFQQMLQFIYTDTCDFLKIGQEVKVNLNATAEHHISFELDMSGLNGNISAYSAIQQQKKKAQNSRKNGPGKGRAEGQTSDPVKALQEVARKFGVKTLVKRLEAVKYVDGRIQAMRGRHLPKPRLKLDRSKYTNLYDVAICGDDGHTVPAHKCVLVARLEYFHSMLASGWIETSNSESLTLPIQGSFIEIILDFLYTDEASAIERSENVEFICNVLVVADQLLIGRLKDICEATAASLLSLRNCCELLEFASVYNASQLRASCQQFICQNLAPLMEAHCLDVLSEEPMQDLTNYYRQTARGMDRRMITPYSDWPDSDYLETLVADLSQATPIETSPSSGKDDVTMRKGKNKRRRSRTKSSGEESEISKGGRRMTERTVSVSSETGFPMEIDEIEEEVVPSTDEMRTPQINLNKVDNAAHSPGIKIASGKTPLALGCNGKPPVEVTSPVSGLRQIMEQEKDNEPTPARLPSVRKSGKLSQKERKKLQQQQQQHEESVSADMVTDHPENDAASTGTKAANGEGAKPKAWSTPAPWTKPMNSVVKSFRDLMIDEEKRLPPATTAAPNKPVRPTTITMATTPAKGIKSPHSATSTHKDPGAGGDATLISWGLPTSVQRVVPQSKEPELPAVSSPPAGNPWKKLPTPSGAGLSLMEAEDGACAASPPAPSVSFTDIIQDEQHQTQVWEKVTNKPLSLIQVEEQAMNELLALYQSQYSEEEHIISVERVHRKIAAPTWAANTSRF